MKKKKSNKIIKIAFPDRITQAGELVGIMYRKKGDKNKILVHAFDEAPKLYTANGGTQIIVVGGNFKYGVRGFVEK